MNQEEIKSHIPHREPMLLLDEAELLEDSSSRARFTIPEKPFYCCARLWPSPVSRCLWKTFRGNLPCTGDWMP